MNSYSKFLASKSDMGPAAGFEPIEIPAFLFSFQRHLVDWAIRRGRAAIFADCGMGKTPMALAWADNCVRHANRPALVLTPLAVGRQYAREAEHFGIEAAVSRDGSVHRHITITNYEQLKHFNPGDFCAVVCDESSILKNFSGKTKAAVTEFMRTIPYRLLCTATAAPNDYDELGTSSEAIGGLGYMDMISRFFRQETKKDHLGWGRTKYRIMAHAERDFWRWVVSWSRACRKPSDLGFPDDRFHLPALNLAEHVVESRSARSGFLFDLPAETLPDQMEERRRTIPERVSRVAELVEHYRPVVVWCHLNEEADEAEKAIPDAVQVSGSDPDDRKVEVFDAFASGQVRVLVSKPKIAGFGLNWQHCSHQTFFPSHSFEQFYQAVRRSYRFGQANPVAVDIVSTAGEAGVLANLQRKQAQAEAMFTRMVELMRDQLTIDRTPYGSRSMHVPAWARSKSEERIMA